MVARRGKAGAGVRSQLFTVQFLEAGKWTSIVGSDGKPEVFTWSNGFARCEQINQGKEGRPARLCPVVGKDES